MYIPRVITALHPLRNCLVPGPLEKGGEVGASARKQRSDRLRRGAEDPGDLKRGHVVLPPKRHCDSPPLGKGGDGATDRFGELLSFHGELLIHGRRTHRHGIELTVSGSLIANSGTVIPCPNPNTDRPRYHSLVPKVVEGQVPNRRVQPRPYPRVHLPCRARSPDGEKHVLHQFLGDVARAHVGIGESPQLGMVGQIERLERALIASSDTDDEA